MLSAQTEFCNQGLFFELLKRLGLAGYQTLENDGRPYEDQFANAEVALALSKEQLQSLTFDDGASLLANQCVVLPHFAKEGSFWLPILWINIRSSERVSIQMAVVGARRRCGYRWESPESGTANEKVGDHDFWHVQPIISIRRPDGRERSLELDHQHISTHFPTIPVDAVNVVQLFDALMVSLYGPRYSIEMIDEASVREQLHACSRSRQWASSRPPLSVKKSGTTSVRRQTRRKKG